MMTEDQKTRHLPYLDQIARADVEQLRVKDKEYGASWKSRGGVGAFMMLARKWDRLENMVKALREYRYTAAPTGGLVQTETASSYDVFEHARLSQLERGDSESLLDTLGDLRRYLLLVEAEVLAASGAGVAPMPSSLDAFKEMMNQCDPMLMVAWLNKNGRFSINTATGEASWVPTKRSFDHMTTAAQSLQD